HARNIRRLNPALQALSIVDLLLARRIQPQFHLPLGHDPAWQDAVDADVLGAQLARQRARQARDRSLGGNIGGAVAVAHQPGNGAEIDDRASASIAHLGTHGLGCEELMAQIDRHALVPIVHRHILGAVAVVVAGVVHEYTDRPMLALRRRDGRAQILDLAQIAGDEIWGALTLGRDAGNQGPGWLLGQIHEGDARALRREVFHQTFADAAAATADEDGAVF